VTPSLHVHLEEPLPSQKEGCLGSSSLLGAAHRTQRYTLWIDKLVARIVPTVKRLRVIAALTISSALRVEA
jgi:hypothetical protein